jgi:hypothetical protein
MNSPVDRRGRAAMLDKGMNLAIACRGNSASALQRASDAIRWSQLRSSS